MQIKVMKERQYKVGYIVRDELIDGIEFGCEDFVMKSAYTFDGAYIGDSKTAYHLCKIRGIAPEPRQSSEGRICSIGFCEREQKWYGWSHRALYGFGIGSQVKKGDCAYTPVDWEDARDDAIHFWTGEHHIDVTAINSKDDEDKPCFYVSWTGSDKIPNKKMRGEISGVTHYPPGEYGRGEWIAETLEDAKQMACDFAESVG